MQRLSAVAAKTTDDRRAAIQTFAGDRALGPDQPTFRVHCPGDQTTLDSSSQCFQFLRH